MKQTSPILFKLLHLFTSFLFACVAYAQEIEVTGKVTDESGNPIYNVNILEKGTSNGTVTDSAGIFKIKTDKKSILICSSVGFTTLEVPIENILNIKLEKRIIQLDIVEVYDENRNFLKDCSDCGPGFPLPESRSNLPMGNIYHPYQLMRGRMPGLTISKPGGDPLGNFDVYQRGQHSLYNTDPLVIIDGLPGASLFTMDVQDIESITIVRDASLLSLYGARGANGVIEIQSKKSNYNKKFKMTYSGYAALDQVTKTPAVLDAARFRSIINNPNSRYYDPTADFGASTNWAEEITRKGLSQAHNLAFRGGFKNTSYRLSLNYRDVNGAILHSGFNQTNMLLHISQDLFKNKVQLRGNAGITQRHFEDIDKNIFYYTAIYNPTAPVYTDTSSFGGYFQQLLFDYQNPVALLHQIRNKGQQSIRTAGLSARWNIINNLNLQARYHVQGQNFTRHYRPDETAYRFGSSSTPFFNYDTKIKLVNQSFTTTLDYNMYVNDNQLNITGGYQYQDWTNEAINASRYDLASVGWQTLGRIGNVQSDSLATAFKVNPKLAAFFTNIHYNFNYWLFTSANWRLEGSNRFGGNHKWGNFYGVGAGVDFAELTKMSFASQLKLKVGYGVAGNLPVDGVFSKQTYQVSGKTYYNGYYIDYYTPATNNNPDLKWEERREWNISLDTRFIQDRLYFNINLYKGNSSDLINEYYVDMPPNVAPVSYTNSVELKNHGVEISFNTLLYNRNHLFWEFGINYAMDRTKFAGAVTPDGKEVSSIQPGVYLGVPGFCCVQPVLSEKGKRLGRFVGFQFDHFENGFAIFKDVNKDGVVDNNDQTEIGNAFPDFTFGIINNFRLKRLEISFFLRGAMGHDVINTYRAAYQFSGYLPQYNVLKAALDPVKSFNYYAPYFSDYNVEDASFVTLENLALGYRFTPTQSYLSALKIYVAAQNLFTLSKYKGEDPEVRLKNRGGIYEAVNALVPGLDVRVGYFPTRTVTLGLQAEF